MNQLEYSLLKNIKIDEASIIKIEDLKNTNDRTLIWGYDLERNSVHVYIKNKKFFKVCYSYPDVLIYFTQGYTIDAIGCIPSKRIYPEASDLEFCEILVKRGISLAFTTFDEKRLEQQYYGALLEDLKINKQ